MKAILVIDVPTESLENVIASVNICEQREGYNIILKRMGKMCLKPMPQKKVVTVKRIEDIQSYSITQVADKISAQIILKTNEVFALGWNSCLDSIIGENNESNISD